MVRTRSLFASAQAPEGNLRVKGSFDTDWRLVDYAKSSRDVIHVKSLAFAETLILFNNRTVKGQRISKELFKREDCTATEQTLQLYDRHYKKECTTRQGPKCDKEVAVFTCKDECCAAVYTM